jgi:DNA-binding LacI/PurR family transcriptional regulator
MGMPEYMRVRQHLYNLIDKADDSSVQIPPENELCRLFGVSRVTVRGAIRGLVKDKFLTPKRGLGTFINPRAVNRSGKRVPIVGILVNEGKQALESFTVLVAGAATRAGMRFEPLFIPESGNPERFAEATKAGIDAIIWMSYETTPIKFLLAARERGVPVLHVDTEGQEKPFPLDKISAHRAERGAPLAEYVFARGHRDLLLIHNFGKKQVVKSTASDSTHARYMKRMAELCAGGRPPRTGVMNLAEFAAALKSGEARNFSLLYAINNVVPYAMDILHDAGLSVPEDFSFLSYESADPLFFGGLAPDCFDIDRFFRPQIIEWLRLRLIQKDLDSPFQRHLKMDITPGQTVRDLNRERGT